MSKIETESHKDNPNEKAIQKFSEKLSGLPFALPKNKQRKALTL